MLGRALEIGGLKNGEFTVSSGVTEYYGGSPAKMTTGGTLDLCTSDLSTGTPSAYVGIFANSKLRDFAGRTAATHKATFYSGTLICQFTSGTTSSAQTTYADALPYTAGDSWAVGSPLYVAATGKWTLTDPGSGIVRGTVLEVGTTYLTVLFY